MDLELSPQIEATRLELELTSTRVDSKSKVQAFEPTALEVESVEFAALQSESIGLASETGSTGKAFTLQETPLQSCQSNSPYTICSAQGYCVFTSQATGASLDTPCLIGDPSCIAQCVCIDGYAGASCSYTYEDLLSSQTLRSSMLDVLVQLVATGDPSVEEVSNW